MDSLKAHLSTFTATELYVLFQQNGLLSGDRKGKAFVEALATGRFPFEEIEKFCKGQKSLVDSFLKDSNLTLEGLAMGEQSAGAAGAVEGELGVVPDAGEESAELPKVFAASPPRKLVAARTDSIGRKLSVLGRMPFGREVRPFHDQRVLERSSAS